MHLPFLQHSLPWSGTKAAKPLKRVLHTHTQGRQTQGNELLHRVCASPHARAHPCAAAPRGSTPASRQRGGHLPGCAHRPVEGQRTGGWGLPALLGWHRHTGRTEPSCAHRTGESGTAPGPVSRGPGGRTMPGSDPTSPPTASLHSPAPTFPRSAPGVHTWGGLTYVNTQRARGPLSRRGSADARAGHTHLWQRGSRNSCSHWGRSSRRHRSSRPGQEEGSCRSGSSSSRTRPSLRVLRPPYSQPRPPRPRSGPAQKQMWAWETASGVAGQ